MSQIKNRIGTILSCHTIYPDDNNPPEGNQARFPQDIVGPHREIDQEESGKSMNTKMDTCT